MLPERSSGILLHMTSLPSRYGIGDMGEGAYRFIDFLKNAGQRVWQMLPVTPTGLGYSPYFSSSSFKSNPLLIDLAELVREGLLDAGDLETAPWMNIPDTDTVASVSDAAAPTPGDDNKVDYDSVVPWKRDLLNKAVDRFYSDPDRYQALADRLEEYKSSSPFLVKYYDDYDLLTQFFFDRQWRAMREYAHEQGILLVGDIPFYVAPNSEDVREHPELFQLDEDGNQIWIAGVPPDYFSETGQVWSNPVYDWTGHGGELTDWWIRRIKHNLTLFDLVRLDHFRGFESYWVIPAGAETAIDGHWEKGPGIAFFDALRDALAKDSQDGAAEECGDPVNVQSIADAISMDIDLPLIAEDLGDITDDVRALLRETGLPGMKVLQFAFGAGDDNDHLPHNYWTDNCVCYTGTHDNDTIRGWFEHAPDWVREHAMRYLGCGEDKIVEAMIKAALHSKAALSVVPMQDVLGLGREARMNVPGKADGNWDWRVTDAQLSEENAARLRAWTCEAGRCPAIQV